MQNPLASGVLTVLLLVSASAETTAQTATPTDAGTRMDSWARHVQMEDESIFRDLQWQAVGPILQGGRIEAIAVPKGNPDTIYLAPGSGNLWKTVNNGLTWQPPVRMTRERSLSRSSRWTGAAAPPSRCRARPAATARGPPVWLQALPTEQVKRSRRAARPLRAASRCPACAPLL